MGAPHLARYASPEWKIDDFEKAKHVIVAMRCRRPEDGLYYLLTRYPDLGKCTHERIAEILGKSRETITRSMKRKPDKNAAYEFEV